MLFLFYLQLIRYITNTGSEKMYFWGEDKKKEVYPDVQQIIECILCFLLTMKWWQTTIAQVWQKTGEDLR